MPVMRTGKSVWSCALAIAIIISCAVTAAAQETRAGRVGLSVAIQNDQLEILVPVWASERFVVRPALGVVDTSDIVSHVSASLMLRYNIQLGKAVPYVGARGAVIALSANDESLVDYAFGPVVGGEYFLGDRFSLSVEGHVNITLVHDSEVRYYYGPGEVDFYEITIAGPTIVNTAALAMATFYF